MSGDNYSLPFTPKMELDITLDDCTPNIVSNQSANNKKKRSYDFQNRKIRRRIWQEDEVHKLICVWATRLDDLRQSKKNRHIYEEISEELNRMGLDTIREEVHIKIQNLSQLYRNEKRRIEGTGEAPTWQYYHEVDELLGSHADTSLDISDMDGSNIANSTMNTTKDEIVSIGDSGSDNEPDEPDENNHSFNVNYSIKNGFDHQTKKSKLMHDNLSEKSMHSRSPASAAYLSIMPKTTSVLTKQPTTAPNNINERKSVTMNTALDALLQAIDTSNAISDANLTPNNVQLEILKEIRKANAFAELERREAKMLHQEMRELEEQRFNLTQMFIERSLTLQKQMLDSLRSTNRGNATQKTSMNGGGSGSSSDNSFKFSSRQQSNRPQFILAKKKK